ncbi:uncharacterized protein LOC114718564 [Neltuma alba]|uniref:uncharacterized protein LOC114718564 n=1 Tax=Neltuma alba TaxID=207710 RepID=UPI0010A41097|nr:uncharacterized protein LOC114718564 [Prosopis alba]
MNSSISIHESFQDRPPSPDHDSLSIQILHSSILNLINSWRTRQKWLHLLCITTKPRTQSVQDQNFAPNWRNQLVSFLESTWVHMFSVLLLVLDLLITISELSSSWIIISCDDRPNYHQNRTQEKAELGFILHWVGIGILGLLSVKTMALLVGLGWSFFRHGGYVLDGSVVIGALVLEGLLEKKGGGLVVIVMLWRVIRVLESAFELSDEAIEAQIEAIICQFEAVGEENRRLSETIQKLKDDLDQS